MFAIEFFLVGTEIAHDKQCCSLSERNNTLHKLLANKNNCVLLRNVSRTLIATEQKQIRYLMPDGKWLVQKHCPSRLMDAYRTTADVLFTSSALDEDNADFSYN